MDERKEAETPEPFVSSQGDRDVVDGQETTQGLTDSDLGTRARIPLLGCLALSC